MSDLVNRLWGAGDLRAVFGDAAKVVAPWPRAPRSKHGPDSRTLYTRQILQAPIWLSEVDPRQLFASQGWVVRHHAEYYRTGEWELTGITSADRDSDANRFPIVVCDRYGRRIISTGHHRALAALIEGRPLLCRKVPDVGDEAVALLPRLLFGPSTRLDHVECESVAAAIDAARSGQIALCTDLDVAKAAGLAMSPSLPHRHLVAIEPAPIPVADESVEETRAGWCGDGLCTTCGGLKSAIRVMNGFELGDHCWCETRPDDLTAAQRESRLPCVLCQVCRLEVVKGHFRWRWVMCESCRPRAKAFNERVGLKILLPGIHSIVNGGPLLEVGNRTPSEAEFVGFADQLNGMVSAVSAFSSWSRRMVLERLRTLGFEAGQVIPLEEYLSACEAAGIDRDVGWAELEAHMFSTEPSADE